MTISVTDAKKITTIEKDGLEYDVYKMIVRLPTVGTQTVIWTGENDETFVASIKIRQELDPLYRDPVYLMENYIEKERSMAEIADDFGVTPMTIYNWLRNHDIKTRPTGARKQR